MGAPAAAVRARPTRSDPRRRRPAGAAAPAPARRRPPSKARSPLTPPAGVAMLPVQAVGGMADSGLVVGMTRGRAWIVVLGILLGGIVALNVLGLSLSASTTGASTQIDELESANTVLRAKIGGGGNAKRAQALAAGLGLQTPEGKDLRYLKATGKDVAAAATVFDGLAINPALAEAAGVGPVAGTEAEASVPEAAPVAAETPGTAEPAVEAAPAPIEPAVTDLAPAPAPAPAAPAAPVAGGLAP